MSAQNYWNSEGQGNGAYQNYGQPQGNQTPNDYPPQSGYSQQQQSQQPPQIPGYHDNQSSSSYATQRFSSYEQHQSYNSAPQGYIPPYDSQSQPGPGQYQSYDHGGQPAQPPPYGSGAPDYGQQSSSNQYPPNQYNQYDQYSYPPQGPPPPQAYPGGSAPGQAEGEKGLLGALGGAAAGGFAGHKMGHGVLGTLGGAFAGHILEDKLKEKKKKDQHDHGRPGSSGSNSSDHHKHHNHGDEVLAGNFSGSSTQISLDRDYDLIASCGTVDGGRRLSSIDLNDCLTNSWGQFQWARGGGFGASSRNARLVDGGRVLEAELGDGRGGWNVSRIRLDERITNNDGDLQFLG